MNPSGLCVPGLFLVLSILSPGFAAEAWNPRLYFGTVNSNQQLLDGPAWAKTRDRVDGMLLHLHFFVRHMETPGNKVISNADTVIRGLTPLLKGKPNLMELTFHIQNSKSSPEEIGRGHASNLAYLESLGIPVAGVTADWILSIWSVATNEVQRREGEAREDYGKRVLQNMVGKSARYIRAFRAAGGKQAVHAVFPPVYMDEGRWVNARKSDRLGLNSSDIVLALGEVGFAGFVADSPFGIMQNPDYQAQGYLEALKRIEARCREKGLTFGLILNGDSKAEAGEAYDLDFGKNCLEGLELLKREGLRPDPLVLESWYRGPYRLVPETAPGTFTHTVLEIGSNLKKP